MSTFVALLRAVNVGGVKVAMAELRGRLEGLGLTDVQTHVQSGNVVFDAVADDPAVHAAAVEDAIRRGLGLDVRALVLSAAHLARIAQANPFLAVGADQSSLHATFLFEPVTESAFTALALPAREGEQAALGEQVAYLHLPHGYGRSKLSNAYFERALRTAATTRNWRTVTTLVELSSRHA
jgi:uncharacterized protein (DUF1697 family)